jgi:hypothetical protein
MMRGNPVTILIMAAPEPVETADSYPEACKRLSYWGGQLVTAGLSEDHGVYLKRLRLSERRVTWGIYVGDLETAERAPHPRGRRVPVGVTVNP